MSVSIERYFSNIFPWVRLGSDTHRPRVITQQVSATLYNSFGSVHWSLEAGLQKRCTMRVLPKLSHYRSTAVLSVLLLFSSNFACWSQLLQPMSPEECCAKGACKRTPGQPPHSSCRITPASSDRVAPPVASAVPAPQMTHILLETASEAQVWRYVSALRSVDYSPPDLFLAHSSFLI